MEDTLQIPTQTFQDDPPLKKLWKGLNADKKYTKSYDEFQKQYSTPEAINKLYTGLKEDGDYTKSADEFQAQYFGLKKKEPSVSPSSDTPSTLPSQSTSVEVPAPAEQPVKEFDPIAASLQYNELKDKKKLITTTGGSSFGMGTEGGSAVSDDEAVAAANVQKKAVEDAGFNPDRIAKDFTGIPENIHTAPGFSKKELLIDYKDNPRRYEQKIATAKWQSNLKEELGKIPEGGKVWNELKNYMNVNVNEGDYEQQRGTIRHIMGTINQYGGDKKEDIIRNAGIDFTNTYGKMAVDEKFISDNAGSKLNNLQSAATKYLQDIHPNELNKYSAAFIDDEKIKDNDAAKLAKEEASKKLEEIGMSLSKAYLEQKFAPIKKQYELLLTKSQGEGLTPEELQQAQQLEIAGGEYKSKLDRISEDERVLGEKYPNASGYEARNFAQELIGQNHWWGSHALLKIGEATENTANGIYDFVAEPFRSEEGSQLRQAEILGKGIENRTSTYVTGIGGKQELSDELKAEVDRIKKDDSLSYDQKLRATTQLLVKRNGEWYTNNAGSNHNLKSLVYGITDLAAGLVPFMAAEMATGGGASASFAKKFTSTFVSAAATSFEDSYRNALERGEKNPYAYATRVTAISSAAIAGAGTPDKIRAIFSKQKTAIGDLVNKMSDKEIEAVLKETPSAFKSFKSTVDAIKKSGTVAAKSTFSSFKDAAKINIFMSGGQVVNDAISGELKSPVDYAKDFAIETLKFGLMTTIGKAATKIVKPTDMGLASLYEAATNKDALITHLDQQIKDGLIEPAQAQEVRKNIEDVSKIYKKNEEVISVLFDKQKREYLYNALMEERNSRMAKALPEQQAEKYEIEAQAAKHKNALMLEPKSESQLEKRKAQVEKSLIPEKDAEGKNIEIPQKEIIAAKAEIKAIDEVLGEYKKANESGVAIDAPIQSGESVPLKTEEQIRTENGVVVEPPQQIANEVPLVEQNPIDRAKELVNSGVVQGFSSEPLKQAANNDPVQFEKYLENIAEQANDPMSKQNTIDTYGQELVDIATSKYSSKEAVGGEPPVGEGVVNEGAYVENPEISFTKGEFVRARNKIGIDEFVDEGTTTHIAESTKAQRTIEKWREDGTYGENMANIQERATKGQISNQEKFIFAKHLADLDATVNSIKDINSVEYDKALGEYNNALDAADKARSEAGRQLGMIPKNRGTAQTLADVMVDMMGDKGVDVLTPEQKIIAEKRYNDVKLALDKEAALRIEAENKVAELEAENAILKTKKESIKNPPKKNKTAEDYKNERTALRKSIKDKWNNAGKDILSSDIPYRKQLAAIAPDVAKLIRSYVDQNTKIALEEVRKLIKKDLEEDGIKITNEDVREIIAGNFEKKKHTKNELSAQVYDLRREEKLLLELDALESGKEPTTEKGKQVRNQRLKDIRDKIEAIKKQNGIGKYSDEAKIAASEKAAKKNVDELEEKIANNDLEFDKIDKPTSPQLEAYREKQKALRKELEEKRKEAKVGKYSDENRFISTAKQRIAANKKIQDELQDKINKGDYAEKPQNQSILENTQFKEKYPKLYKEYEQSIIDKDKKAFEYEQKRINDKIKNYGWVEKFGHGVSIALHTSKGTVAIFDQSGLLVQLIQTTGSHPWETAKNVLPALRDLVTNKWFDANMAKLKTSKYWDIMEKMELPLYDTHSHDINFRNDLLGGDKNLLNRDIAIGGKKFSVGKAFERSTATLFNNIRTKLAIDKIDQLYTEGKTWENAPEEFKAAGRVIAEFTGHGKVAKSFTNENWNLIIWSAKMMASTFNTLGLGDAIRPVPAVRTINNDLAGTRFGKAVGLKEKALDPKRSKGFYSSLTPQQRKFAAKEMVRFILSGATVMAAAYAKGKFLDDDDKKTTVDVNPLSTEFGTIKSGNKTVNVYGRYSSTVGAIAQIAMGVRYLGGGKKDVLGDKFGDKSAGDIAFVKFGRGKMTPMAGLLYDYKFNNKKNYFTKEEITPTSALKQVAVPLAWQDLAKDIQREDPALVIALCTLFKIYGGNVKDDRDYKKQSQGFIKK